MVEMIWASVMVVVAALLCSLVWAAVMLAQRMALFRF